MREKLATLGLERPSPRDTGPGLDHLTAGVAGDSGCEACVVELDAAGKAFDEAFAGRDYDAFIGMFHDANATGLGADGTMGLNRDAWGRILREYFQEPTWTLTVTPVKTAVQYCSSGQILEVVRFDSADTSVTFVHVTAWIRSHGRWRVVLQTEAGPIEDARAVLDRAERNRDEVAS
jgi:hypothetical protein